MTFPYALIALGTNLPFADREGEFLLRAALEGLAANGLPLQALSPCVRTPAWPDPADPPFTNAVAILDARGFTAQGVLGVLLQMEAAFGRVRSRRNAPRTLDLDVLDFAGAALEFPGLSVPHPRLHERLFVLEPLSALWPDWRHPITGERAVDLYHALRHRDGLQPPAG